MKALYLHMKLIAENSPAPLFKMYRDDLYKRDFDIVNNDLQEGDCWYWSVKECGTYLTLADKNSEYLIELMSPKHAPERRHFLIKISKAFEKGYEIQEYSMATIAAAVAAVKIDPNRKPSRQFNFDLITSIEPKLEGSVLFSDFTCSDKGATLYLNVTNNSLSYVTGTGKTRAIGLPFSFDRQVGAYKITCTSAFGHATLEKIKLGVFQRAQKKILSQRKAP